MPFFSRKTEQKESRALGMMNMILGPAAAVWSGRNYRSYAREAYEMNVIANSAINRLAKSVSSIRFQARVNGKLVPDHEVLSLMRRPNSMMSGIDWWTARITYLQLSGNNYDELSQSGSSVELWPLRPDRMKVHPGTGGIPSGYTYEHSGNKIFFPVDPITAESEINHTKLFNPLDDWIGLSPVAAAAFSVDQHNESMSWVQALLQNSARPSGAMTVPADRGLSDSEFNRLKNQVEENYSGSRNAGRPMLLEGGLDWKQMGLSPIDMEILRAREMAARDISLAFGIPPLLLNIPGDNTYANYREARLGFYEDTVLPFVKQQLGSLSHFLQSVYPDLELEPDMDSIEAIAEKRMKQWEMADNSDDLTLNESRALKGHDPLPEPLGSTLMLELRKGQQQAAEAKSISQQFEDIAYGPR